MMQPVWGEEACAVIECLGIVVFSPVNTACTFRLTKGVPSDTKATFTLLHPLINDNNEQPC